MAFPADLHPRPGRTALSAPPPTAGSARPRPVWRPAGLACDATTHPAHAPSARLRSPGGGVAPLTATPRIPVRAEAGVAGRGSLVGLRPAPGGDRDPPVGAGARR